MIRSTADPSQKRFERLLGQELRRARLRHWFGSLPWVKLVQGAMGIVIALLIRLRPPVAPAAGEFLASLFWIFMFAVLLVSVIWPWRRLPSSRRLLREVEGRRERSQILETAADHAAGRLDGKGYSTEILNSVLDGAVSELAEGLPAPPRASRRVVFAGLGMVLIALWLLASLSSAGIRPIHFLLTPGEPDHYEERAWLDISPGSVELLAGSDLELKADPKNLPWRFAGDLRLEIDETGDLPIELPLESIGFGYGYGLHDIRNSFSYRFSRGRQQGDWYRVHIFHPPVADSLSLTAYPPDYTAQPPRVLDLNSGEIGLPEGSRLTLEARSSSVLSEAWLLFEAGDSLPLSIAKRHMSAEFPLDRDRRLALSLRDLHGVENRGSWLLTLRARADQGPEVDILSPEPDADLNRDLITVVDVIAADDYAVAGLQLKATILSRRDTLTIPIPLEGDLAPRRAERILWNLEGMQLFPGDIVEYWAEVWDNRPHSPQWARSAIHRLHLPSLRALVEGIESEDMARAEDMDDLLEEGRQMQEDLRALEEELRADPEMDWEKEEKLREALERQEALTDELGELTDDLQERLEEMAANELMREETREKLEKIQQMMEDLSGTEAGEILRRFEEMLAEMDPESLPDDLADMRMDQEALLEQLERTEALLEKIMREQKLDSMLQQADELLEQQEQLAQENKAAEEDGASQEEKDSLADRQEALAEDSDSLEEDMAEASEEMAEDFPEAAEDLAESEEPPSEPMREAAEEMKQQEKQQEQQQQKPKSEQEQESEGDASKSQQEAMKRLLKLYWRISEAQSSMSSQMDAASLAEIEQVTRDALEFSGRVEQGRDKIETLNQWGSSSEGLGLAARRQMDLYRVMERVRDKMREVAAKTLAVSQKALREASRAEQSLQSSVAELEARASSRGLSDSNQALSHVNLTVVELLQGLQQMGQGSGSCDNPMGQMQSMLQQQEQLNSKSQGMKEQMKPGGLTPQQRAGMQRLKAEQEAVRKGLDELGGSEGEGEVLGRLDQIMEEMREVERDLEGGRLNDETIRRQEKIFERLLDAQRSLHRQDFKRERESRSGDNLAPLWPGECEGDDPLEALREAIRRGLGEDMPSEYEDLVREYYRGLLENERGKVSP
jgi:hypothetical protein